MFKFVSCLLLCTALLLVASQTASAGSNSFSAGYTGWWSTWNTPLITSEGTYRESESKTENVKGPTVTLHSSSFVIGYAKYDGNYVFDMPEISSLINIQRKDTDYYIGYDVTDNFSIIYGRKENTQKIIYTISPTPVNTIEVKTKGQYFALNGHTSNNANGLSYYFTYKQISLEVDNPTYFNRDIDGRSLEVGMSIRVKKQPTYYTLGYTYQDLEYGNGSPDTITGFSGSINYIIK